MHIHLASIFLSFLLISLVFYTFFSLILDFSVFSARLLPLFIGFYNINSYLDYEMILAFKCLKNFDQYYLVKTGQPQSIVLRGHYQLLKVWWPNLLPKKIQLKYHHFGQEQESGKDKVLTIRGITESPILRNPAYQ